MNRPGTVSAMRRATLLVGSLLLLTACSNAPTTEVDTAETVEVRVASDALSKLMTTAVAEYSDDIKAWTDPDPGSYEELLAARTKTAKNLKTMFETLDEIRSALPLPDGAKLKSPIPGSPLFTEIHGAGVGDADKVVRCVFPSYNEEGLPVFGVAGGACRLAQAEAYVYDWQVRFLVATSGGDRDDLRDLMYENLAVYVYNIYSDLYGRALDGKRTDMAAVTVEDTDVIEQYSSDRAVITDVDVVRRVLTARLRRSPEFVVCVDLPTTVGPALPDIKTFPVERSCE